MIHFLRNKENRTIVECEVYKDDLSAATNIITYSEMLLDFDNKELQKYFIAMIYELDQIRGWWWEQAKDSGEYKTIDEFVKEKFLWFVKEFDLTYVTD